MDSIEIMENLYHAYFSNEDKNIFNFSLDTDFIYSLQKINELNGMSNLDISNFVRNRFLGMLSSDDPNIAHKLTLHLRFPLYISLQRCLILFETKNQFKEIDFDLNFTEFTSISHVILFRVMLYNMYHHLEVNKKVDEEIESGYKQVFGNKISLWFNAEELSALNSQLDTVSIQRYLDFFSVDLKDIKTNLDPFKIIKSKLGYTVIFLHDFTYNLYQTIEDKFLSSFGGNVILSSEYGKIRGEMFEKYTFMLLKDFIATSRIHKNYFYRDIDGKNSELDFIVEFDDIVLNIECKSARFDTFLADDGNILNDRFISAYKRSYDSIDRFHRTINNREKLSLKKEGSSKVIDLKNKTVVSIHLTTYDMKYIASEIQRDIIPKMNKYEFYPININCIDFQCMLLDIKFGGFADTRFRKYLLKRFELINSNKNLKFDMDEMDVYGFIITETDDNLKTLKIFKDHKDNPGDIDFLISNGVYRNQINKELSMMFLEKRIEDFTSTRVHQFLKAIFIGKVI